MRDDMSFQKGLEQLNISLSRKQLDQFMTYYDLLIEKNKVMNLTSITEYEEVLHKHFLDSLSLVLCPGFAGEGKVIDIGTGAGFPGIPLKIAFPELEILLVDSLNKRVNFLNEVIEELKLESIYAIHHRAEDLGHDMEYREQYDFCVSRAVANLSTLSEYCLPFVKMNGYFIPYKSGKVESEIEEAKKAVTLLGGSIINTISFILPNTDIERTFVVTQKNEETPLKYPRKAGLPSKEPL